MPSNETTHINQLGKMLTYGLKRVAVFCILQSGYKFLLLKRNKDPNKGKFVPVGGKIEPFETPYEAVMRETFEETGIKLSSARLCGVLTETSPTDYNWVSFIYFSEIEEIPAPYYDEGDLIWVDLTELSTLETPPTDWHIYQYVAHGVPFAFSAIYNDMGIMTEMTDELTGKKMNI
jgi:8-oxo-dGTP diphosphatase